MSPPTKLVKFAFVKSGSKLMAGEDPGATLCFGITERPQSVSLEDTHYAVMSSCSIPLTLTP